MLWQTKWKSALDPITANPLIDGILLQNVLLTNGANTINHKLQRNPKGWILVDTTAAISLWRTLPFNNLSLNLFCNGDATVSLWVF